LKAAAHFMVLLGNTLDVGRALFLKNPYGTSHTIVAVATGLSLAALFVWSLLQIRRNMRLAYRAAGWLMLGAYSLGSALLVTVGRAGFGIEQAFAPRYTTLILYLPVALVYLLSVTLETRTTAEEDRRVVNKRVLLPVLVVLFLCSQLLAYAIGIREMSALSAGLRQGKACLLFINNLVHDDCLTRTVYYEVEKLRREANRLDALGFLRPALIKSARVEDIAAHGAQSLKPGGSFVAITQTGQNVYTASGWAILPESGWPADAVLLAYNGTSSDSIVFALADTGEERSIVARTFGTASPSKYARWQKSFSVQDLPANPVTITAWAFDARTGQAFKLDGTHVIQHPSAPIITSKQDAEKSSAGRY
jgi:hypothetical protein